jgi:hypothetical protein
MPRKASNVIRVPKPAKSSFNPDRPLIHGSLLFHQIEHLRHLEKELPLERQTGIDFDSIKTEGQASEYILKMTAILHPQALTSTGK